MGHTTHDYVVALLVGLAGVTAAVTILTIPPLFSEEGAGVWITVVLGCAALAFAGLAVHERRRIPSVDQ